MSPSDDSARGLATGFAELTLEVADLAGLEDFYTDALGLPVLDRKDDRIWLGVGNHARLGLWAPGRKEFGDEGGAHVHFAFSAPAEALRQITDRLRERGVEVKGPVEHDGGDASLYFRDPAGNLVEVWNYFHDGDGAEDGVAALES